VYAALWVLDECSHAGDEWQARLRRVCGGRTVHRRRYAARRIMEALAKRLERAQERRSTPAGPTCLLPATPSVEAQPIAELGIPVAAARARLVNLLSLVWWSPAEEVETVIRALADQAAARTDIEADGGGKGEVRAPRRRKRRMRVDARRGGRRERGGYRRRAA
jgi:hypothetical protein